jgi:hypothetical protein
MKKLSYLIDFIIICVVFISCKFLDSSTHKSTKEHIHSNPNQIMLDSIKNSKNYKKDSIIKNL